MRAESTNRLAPMGEGLLSTGILLVVLRGLTVVTQMPGLPSFWYGNQAIWVSIGIGLITLGCWMLWGKPADTSWRPSVPGRRFQTAKVYVGQECHLCDDAIAMLNSYSQWLPDPEVIEIHSDPSLHDKFCTCIPVVEFDGRIRFRGRVNEELLRRLIEGTLPTSPFENSVCSESD